MDVVPDEEGVAINAIPLATKPSCIVDFMIHRKEKQGYYQITRADGSSKIHLVFSQLLKDFDREDLETLWKLVVDMVINPPWNLPFLGAKGLTSPEQTATVEMVFSRPWTCTFLVAKGLATPELMANCTIVITGSVAVL
ncbi:hypothetical protein Tco_0907300 [Tanacetum coccineum]|uniref:Uncharacterized protein n=1 Tax=Tanacetum coccineum TaxID=301880 RepID=A0ABQ5CJV3_9ASTR